MEFSREVLNVIGYASIVIGAFNCFFGYRFLKIILGILGFILGALLASAATLGFSDVGQGVVIIAGLVGGLIGAGMMVTLYFIGIFILGAGLGCLSGILFIAGSGGTPEPIVLLISATIGGIIALVFQRLVIIVSTSLGGSWAIVSGIFHFEGGGVDLIRLFQHPMSLRYLSTQSYTMFLCWLLLGIAGIIIQYKITGKKRAKKKKAT